MELAHATVMKKMNLKDDIKFVDHDCGDIFFSKVDEECKGIIEETIPAAMTKMARERPDFPILRSKSDKCKEFDVTISISQYVELSRKAAKSFIKLGLDAKCAVGILGFNHPAWCISQFGCIFAGGMACGIYTTNNAEVCKFIINDCHCQIIVVENSSQLRKILSIADQCPKIKAIVQYTGDVSAEERARTSLPLYTWSDFLNHASDDENVLLDSRLRSIKARDVALLIYTSGTTGLPKGVMLSHDNVLFASKMAFATVKLQRFFHSIVSYLPFSHVAANVVDIIGPVSLGITVFFAQPDALKGSLSSTLKEVQPTLFLGVPRVFEKIQEQMEEIGSKIGGLRRCISNWSKSVGIRNSVAKQAGKSTDFAYQVANCLVFKKVKEALGLNKCIYVLSGAAPIAQHTLDFFLNFDIMIHQVYGMSECSGPHSIGLVDKIRIGSAGSLMKGVEMKIADPDEKGVGEICMRGRHVFLGYYNSEEKTREVLDKEGWLHSGDLGKMEDDEFLRITGRIKELIITAGGENVAPVPVEERIKENLPFVSNVMLIGDKRKFISCLLTLKTLVDVETQEPTNMLTPGAIRSLKELGIEAEEVKEVLNCADSVLRTKIDEAINAANKTSVSRAAFVQKWTFLPKDFSIPGGELGPTMKLKRPVITDIYANIIDQMYT